MKVHRQCCFYVLFDPLQSLRLSCLQLRSGGLYPTADDFWRVLQRKTTTSQPCCCFHASVFYRVVSARSFVAYLLKFVKQTQEKNILKLKEHPVGLFCLRSHPEKPLQFFLILQFCFASFCLLVGTLPRILASRRRSLN